ncbi:hypothetical protein AYO46_07435 [Betaproteobacteria bacterium SCGC AG-212-J23]|nr:hypothetical protein AYO46_07435 [Betaproteobacteria bacterium SCGC AG-212-J23]
MLLSGPPSALMFLKPCVEVNAVVHEPPPELDGWHSQLAKERDPDTEISRRLFLGEAADRRGQ